MKLEIGKKYRPRDLKACQYVLVVDQTAHGYLGKIVLEDDTVYMSSQWQPDGRFFYANLVSGWDLVGEYEAELPNNVVPLRKSRGAYLGSFKHARDIYVSTQERLQKQRSEDNAKILRDIKKTP